MKLSNIVGVSMTPVRSSGYCFIAAVQGYRPRVASLARSLTNLRHQLATTPFMSNFPISLHASDQKRLSKAMPHIVKVILV